MRPEMATSDNFACTIGLDALARMDLIVDGKTGVAYVRPKPMVAGSAAPLAQAAGANWTVAESVHLQIDGLLVIAGADKNNRHDFAGAKAALTRALEINPQNPSANYYRGVARQNSGDGDGALADLNRALELDPHNVEALNIRANIRMQRDPAGSIADFTEYLKFKPQDDVACAHRAGARYNQGDYAGAVVDYSRALELNPKTASTWLWRGLSYSRLSALPAAIADYTHALALNARNQRAFLCRAEARQILGQWDDALADFDQYLRLKPANAEDAMLYREVVQLQRGRPSADFKATVAGWQNGWNKSLGEYLTGDLNEAGVLAAAEATDPGMAVNQRCVANYFIGMVRLQRGDVAGAREFFASAAAGEKTDYFEVAYARAQLAKLDAAEKASDPPAPAR